MAVRSTAKQGAHESFAGYTEEARSFLAELGVHNDREWFKEQQPRYEAVVREPTLALIRALAPDLNRISPHLHVSDKKVGGSMMRAQRDTRFSPNADPYKTNIGVHFRHAGSAVHDVPGFYFHMDVDKVMVGAGLWHPGAEALAKVRKHIDEHRKRWTSVLQAPQLLQVFSLDGSSLVRPPKGYDAGHPLIDWLKRKDHVAIRILDPEVACSPQLRKELVRSFDAASAYMQLLHDALGLKFAAK